MSAPEDDGVMRASRRASGVNLAKLSLAALGVVYGDIGTSPLYAMKACFSTTYGVEASRANVLGIVSLVFWSLALVVALKYLVFVVRADNRGEGGVLALLALLGAGDAASRSARLGAFALFGLFGAALLYAEAVITPVVSVLGAVEGLAVGETSASRPVVLAIAVGILVALFTFQKRGTARIGAVFGPAMLAWFAMIAVVGVFWITQERRILLALDPRSAVRFFAAHGAQGFVVLGAVSLAVTGAEAIYTDMGHFGVKPIRVAWFFVAFPALLLNYFGQGALLLRAADGRETLASVLANPFYAMFDGPLRYPAIAVATVAAIIASQALISGAFSLTRQAVQLGFWPRVTIQHTSGEAEGQVYVPEVNTALGVGCVALVVAFGESTNLAAAYGVAVTGTMSVTSVLFYANARRWGVSRACAGALVSGFLAIDLAFFGANLHKLREGGWIPLALAAAVFTLMTTWHGGRARLRESIRRSMPPLTAYLDLDLASPHRMRGTARVPGTAVFLTSSTEGAPLALAHYLSHHLILHDTLVLLSIQTRHVPEVDADDRIEHVAVLGLNVYQVTAVYGFTQTPNALEILEGCRKKGIAMEIGDTTFFLGRETLIISDGPGMAKWRKTLFSYMSRNTRPASAFFQIPASRVVELGTHIEL